MVVLGCFLVVIAGSCFFGVILCIFLLVVFGCFWYFLIGLMILGRFLAVFGVSWCICIVLCGSWQFLVVLDGS